MERALTAVEDQLAAGAAEKLIEAGHAFWTFDGPDGWSLFVEASLVDSNERRLEVEAVCSATRFALLKRRSLRRTVTMQR